MPVKTRQKHKIEKTEDIDLPKTSEDSTKSKRIKKTVKKEVKTEIVQSKKSNIKTEIKDEPTIDSKNVKIESNIKKDEIDIDKNLSKKSFWLMKSEPETRMQSGQDMKFGIEDLKLMKNQTEHWDGVRNYEARNYMKSMKLGEKSFFYHSNCKVPGIAGIMEVVKESYVDHTQFDPKDAHYDPKSDKSNPKWIMVDIKFVRDLKRYIPLPELKELHLLHKKEGKGGLESLSLFTRSRLSIQSISEDEWNYILDLENVKK